jgi:glycosidase
VTGVHAAALPALEEVVMYEANIRAMSAAGDLAGVIDRLDEIEALGSTRCGSCRSIRSA